jgi:hypothetical protein
MKVWLTAVVLILLGLAAWYFLGSREPAVEEAPPPVLAVQEEAPAPAPEPVVEPVAEEEAPAEEPVVEEPPLPDLAGSDPVALEALTDMVGSEPVDEFVAQEAVISKFVASVDALGGRQVPAVIQAVQGPGGEFQATADERPESVILDEVGDPIPQFVVDPANYQRYTPYVEMLEAVDARQVAAVFQRNQPLFDEAFAQLGYAEGDFEQRLRAIIDELLATPDVPEPVRLIKPEAYYLFADEDLESRSAGQKILIRMGPDNAARVKAKLAEIRAVL